MKNLPESRLKFLSCIVCEKVCSGAYSCVSCDGNVHAICGVPPQHDTEGCPHKITCSLCYETTTMKRKHDEIQRSSTGQPSKMLKLSETPFSSDKVGDWVRVWVSAGEELHYTSLCLWWVRMFWRGIYANTQFGRLGFVFSRKAHYCLMPRTTPFLGLKLTTLNAALFVVWGDDSVSFTPFWCQTFLRGNKKS